MRPSYRMGMLGMALLSTGLAQRVEAAEPERLARVAARSAPALTDADLAALRRAEEKRSRRASKRARVTTEDQHG